MDLVKIAHSPEFTYLEKVATIVDEFAAGEVDGATADAIALDAGIDPEDLLAVYDEVYGEGFEKTAADEALYVLEKVASDPYASYLDKAASVAYTYATGALSGAEADDVALELGLDPNDVADIYLSEYGMDMEKTAADESLYVLEKVASDPYASYIEKAAAVVDAFADGALDGAEADAVGMELGVDPDDLVDVFSAVYLDKEAAAAAEEAKSIGQKIGDAFSTYKGHLTGSTVKDLEAQLAKMQKRRYNHALSPFKGRYKATEEALADAISKRRLTRALTGAGAAGAAGGGYYYAKNRNK